MDMVVVQVFNRAGWPPDSTIELRSDTAAAVLTAVRDYQKESGRDLHGDYLAAPLGGLRTSDEVTEMQVGFDLHKAGKTGWQAIYTKYNMDTSSKARPSQGTHTTGTCADISDAGFRAWLKAGNAKRYGLVFTLSPPLSTLNDLDHCQFFPGTNTVALDVTALDDTTPTESERIMDTVYASHNTTFYIIHEGGCDAIPLAQRDVWNTRVRLAGLIARPDLDENLPFLAWRLTDNRPAESNDAMLVQYLAAHGVPVIPTPGKPFRYASTAAAPTDAQLAALVPAIVSGVLAKLPTVPTAQDIGAEVIRQQKLPGN